MARDDIILKNKPKLLEEQDCFVGHSYGEKPLLADDELDISDSPTLEVEDVFAMAPFSKVEKPKKHRPSENVRREKEYPQPPVNQDMFGAVPFNTNPFITEKQEFTDSDFEAKDFISFNDQSKVPVFEKPDVSPSDDNFNNFILADNLRKKNKASEVSKYNLIDEAKLRSRVNKHSNSKKVKVKPLAAGLCNMSFEDYVDEKEVLQTFVPYEVVRGEPSTQTDSYGSLKRRSNPFS